MARVVLLLKEPHMSQLRNKPRLRVLAKATCKSISPSMLTATFCCVWILCVSLSIAFSVHVRRWLEQTPAKSRNHKPAYHYVYPTVRSKASPNTYIASHSVSDLGLETVVLQNQLVERCSQLGDKMNTYVQQLGGWINTRQLTSQVRTLAAERPLLFLMGAILGVVSIVPVLTFLVVATATLSVTFLGFIFFEGTLLTIGTVLLGGVLVLAACVALPVAAFLGVAYLSASFCLDMMSSASTSLKRTLHLPEMNGPRGAAPLLPGGSAEATDSVVLPQFLRNGEIGMGDNNMSNVRIRTLSENGLTTHIITESSSSRPRA